eukprot:1974435-Ditylum_brightwellii.AAC.1
MDQSTDKGEAYDVKLVDESYVSEMLSDDALAPSAHEKLLNCMIDILALPDTPGQDQDLVTQLADTMSA